MASHAHILFIQYIVLYDACIHTKFILSIGKLEHFPPLYRN